MSFNYEIYSIMKLSLKKCSFLLINIIFLILNIYLLKFLQMKKNDFQFKNGDKFCLLMAQKLYNQIANYLNKKYYYNNSEIKKPIKKKKITLYILLERNVTFSKRYRRRIIEGLEENFIFNFTPNNPDYLIYNIHGGDIKKYENSIKIACYTENKIPDFNQADYAIAFHNINYLDRYFRRTAFILSFEYRYNFFTNKDLINI